MPGRASPVARMARCLCGIALSLAAGQAAAQAWLPPQGELDFSVQLGDSLAANHYGPDGEKVDVGHTRMRVFSVGVNYSPSDRWMLAAELPYVMGRYHGPRPHPTEVDDSHEHGTFTDLTLAAHFQLLRDPIAIAPFFAVHFPTHDYETLGHAAPGRGLEELWVGSYVGASLYPWLPRAYVQSRLSYAFVEKVLGVSHDRGNIDLELGYYLSRKVAVSALASWQDTDGGIRVPVPPSSPYFLYHDQLGSETYLRVGGSIGWSISPEFGLYSTYMTSLSGTNGHELTHGVTVGFNYRPTAL